MRPQTLLASGDGRRQTADGRRQKNCYRLRSPLKPQATRHSSRLLPLFLTPFRRDLVEVDNPDFFTEILSHFLNPVAQYGGAFKFELFS